MYFFLTMQLGEPIAAIESNQAFEEADLTTQARRGNQAANT